MLNWINSVINSLFKVENDKHLTPPRIYLARKYLHYGKFTSGRLAEHLVAEYIDSRAPFTVEIFLQDDFKEKNKEFQMGGNITISTVTTDDIDDKMKPTLNAILYGNAPDANVKVVVSTERGLEFELDWKLMESEKANFSAFFSMNSKEKFTKQNCRMISGLTAVYKNKEAKKDLGIEEFSVEEILNKPEKFLEEMKVNGIEIGKEFLKDLEEKLSAERSSGNYEPILVKSGFKGFTSSVEGKPTPINTDRYNQKISLFLGLHPLSKFSERSINPLVGSQVSFFKDKFLAESLVEYNLDKNMVETLDLGFSYIALSEKTPHTPSEFSLLLKNLQNIVQPNPTAQPQLGLSFYKHLASPRRVAVALDPSHKIITNYVDLGVEVKLNIQDGGKVFELGDEESAISKTSVAIATQWQINKNNLVKGKIDQNSIGVSYTGKVWWQPRFSFSVSGTYDWFRQQFAPGFWVVMDNSDEYISEKASNSFSETIAFTKTSSIDEKDKPYVK